MALQADLIQLIQRLSFCRSAECVLDELRESARKLAGADGLTIILRDGNLCHYVEEDAIAPLWKGRRFPMEACISGWCMLHRQQVAIPDVYCDSRVPHEAYRPTFVKSLIMTPIRSEEPVGAIGAYWARHHQASTDELEILQALADSAALALSNVQMFQELQETSRRKDEFLAMLSHELRNPLAPLHNALHLLRPHGQDDKEAVLKAIMERQVRQLTHIVDDLLDVARIRSGKVVLQHERIDWARRIRQDLEDRRGLLEQAGIVLEAELPEMPVPVEGDPPRLAQILGNLLDNARKFTPSGGRVSVRLKPDETSGQAVLTVSDSGIGISAQMLPEIFDAFTQGEQALDRAIGGLGLGLSVVRGLVELHGGTVGVASAGAGKGAEFEVRLPLLKAERTPDLDGLGTGEQPLVEERPVPSFHRTLLVVEDNLDAAESLRELLEIWGYEVTLVHTGPEAVFKAKALRPAAVLCDVGLPDMDGFTIARLLRQAPETASARLIAMTGYGHEADRQHGLEAGFDLYLVKPVDLDTLRSELLRLLPAAPRPGPDSSLDCPGASP